MNYSTNRDRFKSGDLIALTHKAWGSFYDLQIQAVRISTESEYSHVGLVWVVGGRVWVIESVKPFIRMVPLSHLAAQGFYWLPLDKPISDAELEFALSEVGVGVYSKWQGILAFFRRLKLVNDGLWECAKFVIMCRRMSGVDLGDVATPSAVVRAAQRNYDSALHWVEILPEPAIPVETK